jgi:hypothetical protein
LAIFSEHAAKSLPQKTNTPIIEADYPALIEEIFYGN